MHYKFTYMSSLSMQFLIKLDCIACTYFSLFFNHKRNQQVWVYFLEKGGIRSYFGIPEFKGPNAFLVHYSLFVCATA